MASMVSAREPVLLNALPMAADGAGAVAAAAVGEGAADVVEAVPVPKKTGGESAVAGAEQNLLCSHQHRILLPLKASRPGFE